ncbi:unnamed protein product, partial [marine sediment metagenome]
FEEAFTGPVRVLQGKQVRVKWPFQDTAGYEFTAMEALEACQQLNTGGQELSDEDHIKSYIVANMASQILYPLFQLNHPLEVIEGIENIIRTPRPVRDPSTKYVLEEAGIDWRTRDGFLHAEYGQSSVGEFMDIGFDLNTKSFLEVAENIKHDYKGLAGSQSVNDFAQNSLALLEGEDEVELDFHPVEKAIFTIMDNGYQFGLDTSDSQLDCFVETVMALDASDISLSLKDLKPFILSQCGIELIFAEY